MTVKDMGPQDVVTTSPDATVRDVVEQLAAENVGAVVVTEENQPVGILTDRDVALSVNDADDVATQSVNEIMTENPETIQGDEPGMEISRRLGEANVRRLPVVDENDELTGIVTMDDLVATVGEELDAVADTIEVQSPDYQP